MTELFRRLLSRPVLFAELIVASLLVNLLALAPSVYVIQLLNRYLAHGVKGTLATLTLGVLIALSLEISFRWIRHHLATAISAKPDRELSNAGFNALISVKNFHLSQLPSGLPQEVMRGVNKIEEAYSPNNIITFLDLPFSFLIIIVLYCLSPTLALIGLIGFIVAVITGLTGQSIIKKPTQGMLEIFGRQNALLNICSQLPEMIRGFNAQQVFKNQWEQDLSRQLHLKTKLKNALSNSQALTSAISSLLTISIISVGAMLVVAGELSIGSLIGANILAARALMPAVRFSFAGQQLSEAKHSLKRLKEFSRLPLENQNEASIKNLKGIVTFQDAGFVFRDSPSPLFESLSFSLNKGEVLAIVGHNGSGKTTLAKILTGLLELTRGQLLIDGVSTAQLSPNWLRQQIIYLPQEPSFFDGTIKNNILINAKKTDDININKVIQLANLNSFLDTSPKGINTLISENGKKLSLGIRKRIALARGLASEGQIVILDEPTEGLDINGQTAIYSTLNELAQNHKTIIVFSHDQKILKGAHWILDLSVKPKPNIYPGPLKAKKPKMNPAPLQELKRGHADG